MPQYLSPIGNDQFIDANGDPLVGGQVETYLAESSTPAATYTDDSGSTPQSNPIVLNSLGRPTLGPIWLTGGVSYKFIIKNAAGSTLWTIDNIAGVNDATLSQSEWLESGFVPTYINGTSFSVPGDQTGTLQINRRLRTTNTSGFIYSTITNSVFAAGITTVTLVNSAGVLDAGLSAVAYGLLSATNSSIPIIQTAGLADKSVTFSKMQDVATGTMAGRVAAGSGAMADLTPSQFSPLLTSKIQPIDASVASNALTVTVNPTTTDFRSATAGIGSVSTLSNAAAISCVVPNGATLGAANGALTRVAVLEINNAGTKEVAVVNLLGGVNLDERGVISTTALSTGSDSGQVIYSTTARTNVSYRIVGFIEYTQATAGTYATAPSLVNGSSSPLAMWLSGYGQTRQAVTVSRAMDTNYTNSTGRPIQVLVSATAAAGVGCDFTIDGTVVSRMNQAAATLNGTHSVMVLPGEVYRANNGTLFAWTEIR